MKIQLPDVIRTNATNIKAIWIELAPRSHNMGYADFCIQQAIPVDHLFVVDFIELNEVFFNNCSKVRYKVLYNNDVIKLYRFNTKHQSVYKHKDLFDAPSCMRYKISPLCEDTNQGRKSILDQTNNKIVETKKLQSIDKGSKNLIYYVAYFDNEYLKLLDLSVNSILNHSTTEFDILIITDEATKPLIQDLSFANKVNVKYHITESPHDGVEASQNKTNIFDWEDIDQYSKILFVDCDVMALKDISVIFNQPFESNVLYTAGNSNLTVNHFRTIHHGFDCLEDLFINEMNQVNQIPFNAGQFAFKNTSSMQSHFKNLNWMMDAWSGEYFFEQCFMNYYFCKAHLTQSTLLQKTTSIVSTLRDIKNKLNENTCLIHFIGPPLNAQKKIEFINGFLANR